MRRVIDPIRSIFFNIIFYVYAILFLGLVVLPMTLISGENSGRRGVGWFCRGSLWIARWVMGIKYEYRGLELLPRRGALILAATHQSNMDPIMTFGLRPDVTALAKKELFALPVIGPILRKMRIIRVDRQAGDTHKIMQQVGEMVRAEERAIIIYPQATRVRPGSEKKLKPGAYHMAQQTGLPVITVSTNTGLFWRKGFFHRSGTAVFQVQAAFPADLDKEKFMQLLTTRVISDSDKLCCDAGFQEIIAQEKQKSA